ncbi:MAG: hypothetical protein Ta2G_13940 [Termitinemataceae bacterium]|nr:MAG: hypothetical protein Ta2G_13940 [Termitinemataceae bacterium]
MAVNKLQKILIGLLFIIVLVIAVVTITVFASKKSNRGSIGVTPNAVISNEELAMQEKIWSGIGRMRIALNEEGKTRSLIITPVFPYNGSDIAFTEELAANNKRFREDIKDYFEHNKSGSQNYNEDAIKETLLELFNKKLRLGSIKTLYFSEFIFID